MTIQLQRYLLRDITLKHPGGQGDTRQHHSSQGVPTTSSSLPVLVSGESTSLDSTAHDDTLGQTTMSKTQEAGTSTSHVLLFSACCHC